MHSWSKTDKHDIHCTQNSQNRHPECTEAGNRPSSGNFLQHTYKDVAHISGSLADILLQDPDFYFVLNQVSKTLQSAFFGLLNRMEPNKTL